MSARIQTESKAATALMLYMSAQNELATKATENIAAIKSNVALHNLCLYIVEDTYGDVDAGDSNVRVTFRYPLPHGARKKDFNRESFADMDKTIGDPKVFKNFLTLAKLHFKQDGTNQKILILWGHGGGMVMLDEQKANGTVRARASIADFAEVLETQKELKFDIIAFDSCYMGVIEVMNQFREATSFALVSSTVVDADGYPYKQVIRDLKTKGAALEPKTAAELIASRYDKHYKQLLPGEERFLFTCDMGSIENCVVALNTLGDALFVLLGDDEQNDPIRDSIREALIAAHADFAYVPVLMFMRKLADRLAFQPDQNRFKELHQAMDKLASAVRASFSGRLSDSGYAPRSPLIWSPDSRGIFLRDYKAYAQLDSSKKGTGGWIAMWLKFHGIKEALGPDTEFKGKFRIGLPKSVFFALM